MYEKQDTNHVSNEATLDWSELFGHQLITELNSPQELIKVATATIFPLVLDQPSHFWFSEPYLGPNLKEGTS